MFWKRKEKNTSEAVTHSRRAGDGANSEGASSDGALLAAHAEELILLTDPAYFSYRLELEIARAKRYDRPLSYLTFTMRHPTQPVAPHEVIDDLIEALRGNCRPSDLVGRSGYNTMGIIFPETRYDQLAQAGARLFWEATQHLALASEGYTVEMGQATLTEDHTSAADLTEDAWTNRVDLPLSAVSGD